MQLIKGRGVAVTVPDTYVNADPEIIRDPEWCLLFALDTKLGPTGNRTVFTISKGKVSSEEVTLESQISSVVEDIKDVGGTNIKVKTCVHGNSECVEVAFTLMQEGKTFRLLQYWIKEGADVYVLVFTTYVSEFPQRYDEFSQIFSSFHVLEEYRMPGKEISRKVIKGKNEEEWEKY